MSVDAITGPMFSGKTTELYRKITQWVDVLHTTALIINHKYDIRDPVNNLSSHSSSYKGVSNRIKIIGASKLQDVDVSKYNIVGIDEINFFEDDVLTIIKDWASQGKHVVISGLDGNYKAEKFGSISELLPISDTFVKLNAICSRCLEESKNRGEINKPCNNPAPFTEKLKDDGVLKDVGGSDKYIAVCRRHHSYF